MFSPLGCAVVILATIIATVGTILLVGKGNKWFAKRKREREINTGAIDAFMNAHRTQVSAFKIAMEVLSRCNERTRDEIKFKLEEEDPQRGVARYNAYFPLEVN